MSAIERTLTRLRDVNVRVARFVLASVALTSVAACAVQTPAPESVVLPSSSEAAPAPSRGGHALAYFEGSVDVRAMTMDLALRSPSGAIHDQTTLPYGTASGSIYFHDCPSPALSYTIEGAGGHLDGLVQAVNEMVGNIPDLTIKMDSISDIGTTFSTGPAANGSYGFVANTGDATCAANTLTWTFTQASTTNFTFTGEVNGSTPCATDCGTGSCIGGSCVALSPAASTGYWNFEQGGEIVSDLTGNGNNATRLQGTPVPGKVGDGVAFDGTQCIGIPYSPSLAMGGGSTLTMMAWINYEPGCSSDRGVVLNQENTYELGVTCGGSPEALQEATVGSDGWFWTGTPTIPAGTWHHYAVTFDGTTVLHYIDGALDSTDTRTTDGPFSDSGYGFGIGCRGVAPDGTGGISNYVGTLDEVYVFARSVSATEIAAYYAATK